MRYYIESNHELSYRWDGRTMMHKSKFQFCCPSNAPFFSETIVISTRSSAIAERPRYSLFKLWQKYKCEKRASNIALCYGVNVDESSLYCSMAPCLYLMQNNQHLDVNFGAIWRFELGLLIWVFLGFLCWRNLGYFLKVQWQQCRTRIS